MYSRKCHIHFIYLYNTTKYISVNYAQIYCICETYIVLCGAIYRSKYGLCLIKSAIAVCVDIIGVSLWETNI